MVRQARSAHNRASAAALCRVRWLRPDIAWALDGMQYIGCHVQNLQDMCSHYKFAPLTTAHMPCGEEIAGHLDRHLTRFGPPLFLKRDNAGNLNHHPRRSLSGSNACRSYFASNRARYNKRQRRQAWEWIRDLAVDISAKFSKRAIDPSAWRIAARKWLQRHNLIIIQKSKMASCASTW